MKNSFLVLAILFLLTSSYAYSQDIEKTTFYVSATGNDNWSGKSSDPDNTNNDGPFRTFEKAKSVIEELTATEKKHIDISVLIRGGIYTLAHTLILSSSPNSQAQVTWKNYLNEKVQLVGGQSINGFKEVTDSATLKRINTLYQKNIYQANLKASGISAYGTIGNRSRPGLELFFKSKKMTLARWPNEGWTKIADVPQTGQLVNPGELPHMRFGLPVGRHYGRFTYEGNRPNNWASKSDIYLHGYWTWDWYDEFLQVKSIDTVTKEIFIKEPHSHYGYCKEQRYYALNILEELDQPGEWYLDHDKGQLFFWPPSKLEAENVFISLLEEPLIQLDSAENIHIEGITFSYSRGHGLVMAGGKNNLVAGCVFNNLGDIAVKIEGGKNNGIASCDIYDVAAGGIVLSGGNRKTLEPAGNFAVNNHIHDIGQWMRTHQSAVTISGVGNYIAHNLIHNGPNSGIALTGNEHLIEYNDLHDMALETGDVGAFYMGRDWTERGNIIRYNYFHDLTGPNQHDVNAVYLDDWTSGTTVTGNIFYNCARGIMIGGGRDNMVDNNIFIGCSPAVHVDSRGLGWAKYYFDGSDNTLFNRMDSMDYKHPPYSEKYPILLSLYNDQPAVAKNNTLTRNIAFQGRWIDMLDGLDLSTIKVENNIVAAANKDYKNEKDKIEKNNPGIYDYKQEDFRIKAKALKMGFKPLPFSSIGLQKDNYRENPIKTFR
ncbi:MAG: right-handed parallel beta-helix repeat-containing protein [Flavitalea sp.]